MVPAKEKDKTGGDKKKRASRKNALLADGLRSFTIGRFTALLAEEPEDGPHEVAITGVKEIGGAKNGGEHNMLVKNNKPTKSLIRKRSVKWCFRNHKRYIHKTPKKG